MVSISLKKNSVLYLNIFFLNDSTIKFNDSVYELKKSNNSIGYMLVRNVSDMNRIHLYDYKNLVNKIQKTIKKGIYTEFNLYLDSNVLYQSLACFYHEVFMLSLDRVNHINLFGTNNRFVEVNYSKGLDLDAMPVCGMGRYNNIFKIMLNRNNQLMIEDNWDVTYKDIKPLVMEYYTNPDNSEDLPEMFLIDKRTCEVQIATLTKLVENGNSLITGKLELWRKKLLTVNTVGAYKTLPKSAFLVLQLDQQNKSSTYLSLIDSISGGVMELRNNYCIDKFGKKYEELNQNFLLERIMKKAIDMVYPNKINSLVYYGVPKPPPTPTIVPSTSSSW
jgi:hypothetical protein